MHVVHMHRVHMQTQARQSSAHADTSKAKQSQATRRAGGCAARTSSTPPKCTTTSVRPASMLIAWATVALPPNREGGLSVAAVARKNNHEIYYVTSTES